MPLLENKKRKESNREQRALSFFLTEKGGSNKGGLRNGRREERGFDADRGLLGLRDEDAGARLAPLVLRAQP
eukprot:3097627-Rhodomonas_salina.2